MYFIFVLLYHKTPTIVGFIMDFLIVEQNVYVYDKKKTTYIRDFLEDHQLISFVGNFPLPKMQKKQVK